MVERYDFEASWSCSECGTEHETPDLVLNPDGNYVSYKDYEYLEAENKVQVELPKEAIKQVKELLREIRHDYTMAGYKEPNKIKKALALLEQAEPPAFPDTQQVWSILTDTTPNLYASIIRQECAEIDRLTAEKQAQAEQIEKLNGTKKDLEEDLFSSKIALTSFARWNKDQAERIEKLKRLVKECVTYLLAGGYFTPEELEQVLKGN